MTGKEFTERGREMEQFIKTTEYGLINTRHITRIINNLTNIRIVTDHTEYILKYEKHDADTKCKIDFNFIEVGIRDGHCVISLDYN